MSSDYGVHATQIKEWKAQGLEAVRERFALRRGRRKQEGAARAAMYEEIGRLKVELDFLRGKLGN